MPEKKMVASFLVRLAQRKGLTILVAIAYFFTTVFTHNLIGSLLANTFNINNPQSFNRIFFWFGLAGILGYLTITIPPFFRAQRWKPLAYLFVTLLFIAGSVPTIIVVNSEFIHFFQYALLCLFLLPIFQSYWLSLIVGSLLGALDEWIQYTVLSPDGMRYFDFNDVVLNLLGLAVGLIALGALSDHRLATQPKTKKGVIILTTTFALFGLCWLCNVIDVLATKENPAPFTLVRVPEKSFWTVLPPHRRFHVLRPLEGALLLLFLFWFYSYLDSVLRPSGKKTPLTLTTASPDQHP